MTIGIVRVVTSEDPEFVHAHGRALERAYGVPTVSLCIPDQPHGVHGAATHARAAPKVVACALDLAAAVAATLGERIADVRRPDGVTDTTDLLTAAGGEAAWDTAAAMVRDGADTLLFACTGLTTIGLGPWVRSELGVPVVDAVLAAGAVALYHRAGR